MKVLKKIEKAKNQHLFIKYHIVGFANGATNIM